MAELPPGFVLDSPQSNAPPLPPGFTLETPGASPTDDMSGMQKLLAGIGQGMTSAATGSEQLAQHLGGNSTLKTAFMRAIGLPAENVPPEIQSQMDAMLGQQAKLDKPLLDTGAGKVGSFVGQAAATAPIGGAAGESMGVLGNALKTAVQGAATGAVQPVAGVKPEAQLSDLITGKPQGEDFGSAKLQQMGLGAAVGAGSNLALRGAGSLVESLYPANATARMLNVLGKEKNAQPFAQQGEDLAQQTGVMLTPAQVSGSKAGNMAENAARQSIFSRDLAFEGDRARIQQLSDYFDKTLNGVTASEASPAVAGAQVQAAAKNIISNLDSWRSKTAAEDFGKIREMTKGKAPIDPSNTAGVLQQIVDDNAGIGTPGGDALANFARKQLSNVAPGSGAALNDIDKAAISQFGGLDKMTPDAVATAEKWSPGIGQRLAQQGQGANAPAQGNLDKLMQLRSYLSKVAGGQAKISGENQDRRVAVQLLGSIDQDIDGSADKIGGDLGGALKQANARYRELSQQIDSVKMSPLGKILGEDVSGALQSGSFNTIAPETIMQRMDSLKPTELGIVRGLLEKDQPQAWAMLKRGMLENALEKAKQIPASEGANTAVMRPNVLVKTMGDAKKLQAVFDPNELSQIQAGLDVARRLSDKTGYNFSNTASTHEALGIMNRMREGGIKAAASIGGQVLGTRALATMMTNADGRAALMQLQRLPPGSAKARQLTSYLASLSAEQTDAPDQAHN